MKQKQHCLSTRDTKKDTLDCTETRETNTRYYRTETILPCQVHISAAYEIKSYKTFILNTLQESLSLAHVAAFHKLNFLETWSWPLHWTIQSLDYPAFSTLYIFSTKLGYTSVC